VTPLETAGFKREDSTERSKRAAGFSRSHSPNVSSISETRISVSASSAEPRRTFKPYTVASVPPRATRPPRALRRADLDDDADVSTRPHRAAQNLRRHAWRAVRRVGALIGLDAMSFVAARLTTREFAEAGVREGGVLASWALPTGTHELSFATALMVGTVVSGTYGPGDAHRHPGRLCVAAAIGSALPLWSQLWNQPLVSAAETWFTSFVPLLGALLAFRIVFHLIGQRLSDRSGSTRLARTVLVGSAADCAGRGACAALTRRSGFDVIGFIDLAPSPHHGAIGTVSNVERLLVEHDVETVILCGFPSQLATDRVLRAAAVAECTVLASAPQLEHPAVRPNVIMQGGQPILQLRPAVLRAEHLLLKRAMDIIGASIALVLLSPILAIVAALVVLDSPGRALFVQRRLGQFGRSIRCFKFRSMYVDAEARLLSDPALFRRYVENDYKLPESIDNRITPVGRFLRRTSLDELPQLWNVLKGDMSLVGPRPIVPDEIQHYKGEGPFLLSLKPGITGAWQVSGRSALPYPQRAAVELEYVEGWSLWRDVRILLRTIPVVLAGRGAH